MNSTNTTTYRVPLVIIQKHLSSLINKSANDEQTINQICANLLIINHYCGVYINDMQKISLLIGIDLKIVSAAIDRFESQGFYDNLRTEILGIGVINDRGYTPLTLIMLWGVYGFSLPELHTSASKYSYLFSKLYDINTDFNIIMNDSHNGILAPSTALWVLQAYSDDFLLYIEYMSKYSRPNGNWFVHRTAISAAGQQLMVTYNRITGKRTVMIHNLPVVICETLDVVNQHIGCIWGSLLNAGTKLDFKKAVMDVCSLYYQNKEVFYKANVVRLGLDVILEEDIVDSRILKLIIDRNGNCRKSFDNLIRLLYIICHEKRNNNLKSNAVGVFVTEKGELCRLSKIRDFSVYESSVSNILKEILIGERSKSLETFNLEISIASPIDVSFPTRSLYFDNNVFYPVHRVVNAN